MLQFLSIQNLALLDEIRLEFAEGFTTITGETGAGKSILLGALALLSGDRAEKTIIRQGADYCQVEATLFVENPKELNIKLKELGLPQCEDNALLLSRTIFREKKLPQFRINGKIATLSNLQEISEYWIDFHGPGEPQKLFHADKQLEMLDQFASLEDKLSCYRQGFDAWNKILQEIDDLVHAEKLSPEEIEFYSAQLKSIESLKLSEESIETLERDFKRVDNARELVEYSSQIAQLINGDPRNSAVAHIRQALRLARELARVDNEAENLADRIESQIIEIEDIAASYQNLAEDGDFDPQQSEQIQRRMHQWMELKRKYGNSVPLILQKRDELKNKLEKQGDVEGKVETLKEETKQLESKLRKQAAEITDERRNFARKLSKEVAQKLTLLGFKKAQFSIDIKISEKLHATGNSSCEFLFSANSGQSMLPLNKIASSGEMARVMLAIKTVLAEVDHTPVLVFDEVDANVGGEIGAIVGELLSALARKHQVFCVTHLPQVAALGDSHYLVEKNQEKDHATVSIFPIHEEKRQRIAELARMLGDRKSASALKHAEELLKKK